MEPDEPRLALRKLGFCACGCGQETTVPKKSDARLGRVRGQPMWFVHGHNGRGAVNGRWAGGVQQHNGYRLIRQPDHPQARRGYVHEHWLVAEKALGKYLPPGVEVHHVDGDPQGNRGGNLVICQDHGYHMLLEYRTRAYRASGHAHYRKCRYCKRWDDPIVMAIIPTARSGLQSYHRACHNTATTISRQRQKGGRHAG